MSVTAECLLTFDIPRRVPVAQGESHLILSFSGIVTPAMHNINSLDDANDLGLLILIFLSDLTRSNFT